MAGASGELDSGFELQRIRTQLQPLSSQVTSNSWQGKKNCFKQKCRCISAFRSARTHSLAWTWDASMLLMTAWCIKWLFSLKSSWPAGTFEQEMVIVIWKVVESTNNWNLNSGRVAKNSWGKVAAMLCCRYRGCKWKNFHLKRSSSIFSCTLNSDPFCQHIIHEYSISVFISLVVLGFFSCR